MILKRDIICLTRILIDSLPKFIRNSRLLFKIARLIFSIPEDLYNFRGKYESGEIIDLSRFYSPDNNQSIKRISKKTDINSFHLRLIKRYFKSISPKSLLDAGCGTGFLLNKLNVLNPSTQLVGIDYNRALIKDEKLLIIEGDIYKTLQRFLDNSFEFVICTHVIEHLIYPEKVIFELRRVCSKILIVICPMEKKFIWGMNYHINFYSNKEIFLNFLNETKYKNSKGNYYKIFCRLGDIMYVEHI